MSGHQLLSGIERIERLHEEKRTIEDDIKEIYAELKTNRYDTKAIREIVKRRAKDPEARSEFEAIVDLYEQEIANASRAHGARPAREATEHQPARLPAERDPQSVKHGPDSVGGAGGESPTFSTGSGQESAAEPQARNEPGSEGIASGGAGVTARPETPARKPFALRPLCQRPDNCGGYGTKHCGPCERAAVSRDVEHA